MEMELIREQEWKQKMHKEVLPYLEQYKKNGYFVARDGLKIHYISYVRKENLADVVIAHGFGEFAEKYEEMAYYFLQEGYNIYIMEHRGHGYSQRQVRDLQKIHVDSFDVYVRDLKDFVAKILPKDRKRFLLAHSMGGAIAIRYLEEHPGTFQGVVLSSPMCKIRFGELPTAGVSFLCDIMCGLGFGRRTAYGQRDFSTEDRFDKSSCMSKVHYHAILQKRSKDPHYQTCKATYGWVRAGLRVSRQILQQENVNRIREPILILTAGQDHMVDLAAQKRFISRAKHIHHVHFEDSRHEIFHGTEQMRKRFYREVFHFLGLQENR